MDNLSSETKPFEDLITRLKVKIDQEDFIFLLLALEDLVLYSHCHEGWQDDHSFISENAESLVKRLYIKYNLGVFDRESLQDKYD